jgi:hypothetical protein
MGLIARAPSFSQAAYFKPIRKTSDVAYYGSMRHRIRVGDFSDLL